MAGAETLDPNAVLAAVDAIRTTVPAIPVGVTTGLWAAAGGPARRMSLVAGWTGTGRPDFASVNLYEPGAGELASLLADLGIAVEAGLASPDDAERLAASPFGRHVLRILVEPEDPAPSGALAQAAAIDAALDRHALTAPRLHHGEGVATWAVLRAAVHLGRDIRVGLEDTVLLEDGRLASGNPELVQAAARLAAQV